MQITNTSLMTYHTHVVDIETEKDTYSVTFVENDFAWDVRVLNVDECEEVEESDPIYSKLVDAAEQCIWNAPATDSAGFTHSDNFENQ